MRSSIGKEIVFLSGSRDVADLLGAAYEVVQSINQRLELSGRNVTPYYWEFEEKVPRASYQLTDLPRSSDPGVSTAVFVWENRLGAVSYTHLTLPTKA